jgi:hypothetical protein
MGHVGKLLPGFFPYLPGQAQYIHDPSGKRHDNRLWTGSVRDLYATASSEWA